MKVIEQAKVLKLLDKFKVSKANSVVVKSKKEALKASKKIKYPLALKIDSADIIHKTEFNAIRLNIEDDETLEKAYEELEKVAKKKKAKVSGFIMQSMESGQEVIIGAKKDPVFGNVIMFGLGGIFVELMKDVSFRIAPVNKIQAASMIEEIKGKNILEGARGLPKVNIDAVTNIIVNLSKLLDKNKNISEVDFNPVILNEKTAKVVDARMITDEKK